MADEMFKPPLTVLEQVLDRIGGLEKRVEEVETRLKLLRRGLENAAVVIGEALDDVAKELPR